jgi:photosystem II stability/assembly factor-like uncharacterized protein
MNQSRLGTVVAAVIVVGCSSRLQPPTPEQLAYTITEQQSGTTALLQAVSVATTSLHDDVVWVSGHRATWARSVDGGTTWTSGHMTGADSTLQFRDVHAVGADTAYLLAAGPGPASRIYKTSNGGQSWQLQFMNRDTSAFFDCFDFWDSRHGIAVSDAVNGRLVVIGTDDGGLHWTDRSSGMPAAQAGEGAFAASGTCLVTRPGGRAWIAAESDAGSRVYRTSNYGRSWEFSTVPVVTGQATGVASLAWRDDRRGLAAGGKIGDANDRSDNVARTEDGGRTWSLAGRPTFSGAVFGAARVSGLAGGVVLLAAGPKGLDLSIDDGATWTSINANAYWSVGFGQWGTGWAVGPGGRITRVSFPSPRF